MILSVNLNSKIGLWDEEVTLEESILQEVLFLIFLTHFLEYLSDKDVFLANNVALFWVIFKLRFFFVIIRFLRTTFRFVSFKSQIVFVDVDFRAEIAEFFELFHALRSCYKLQTASKVCHSRFSISTQFTLCCMLLQIVGDLLNSFIVKRVVQNICVENIN